MDLDINRIAVTRDGRRWKLLCLDRPSMQPVIGYNIATGDVLGWNESGRFNNGEMSPTDIVSQEPLDTPQAPRPKIDIKKPVKTRNGHDVVLLSDKGPGPMSLVGHLAVNHDLMRWHPDGMADGGHAQQSALDLVQEKEVWLAVRSNSMVGVFQDKRAAATVACPKAIIRVPYVDGQFD